MVPRLLRVFCVVGFMLSSVVLFCYVAWFAMCETVEAEVPHRSVVMVVIGLLILAQAGFKLVNDLEFVADFIGEYNELRTGGFGGNSRRALRTMFLGERLAEVVETALADGLEEIQRCRDNGEYEKIPELRRKLFGSLVSNVLLFLLSRLLYPFD